MSDITISGSSDDLIEIEGDAPGCDEYNDEAASFVVQCEGGAAVRVLVAYTKGGVWAITLAPVSEGHPMPVVHVTSGVVWLGRLGELREAVLAGDLDRAGKGYTAVARIADVTNVIREYTE